MRNFLRGAWVGMLLIAGWCEAANRAGVVIQNSTGEVITRCVEFEETSLTVEMLLRRSGFNLVTQSSAFGESVCFLHDEGNRIADQCFDHPLGWFWNFFTHSGTGWTSANQGISSATVTEGSLVGFTYGAWNEVELPPLDFTDVCGYSSRVGLVIDHGDSRRRVIVVEFPGETLSGWQVLERSGVAITTTSTAFGTALCSLDDEGQSAADCFGDVLGRFWAFNLLQADDSWSFSPVGLDDAIFRESDVAGFFFAPFGVDQPPILRQEIFGQTSRIESWDRYR